MALNFFASTNQKSARNTRKNHVYFKVRKIKLLGIIPGIKERRDVMVGIILASHGAFAEGIKESAQMIFGEQDKFEAVVLKPSMGPDEFRANLEAAVGKVDSEEILLLCDLWGGTPFNQASAVLDGHEDKWAIVAGLNLPMVIEALSERFTSESSHEIAKVIINSAKEGIKGKPESVNPVEAKASAEDAAADEEVEEKMVGGTIPEGTVLGDGKIKIGLARVDTRLLHGQVATTWTKLVSPDRIIVVSDKVATDELRKSMIMEAAPPGVKVHVIPIRKMIEIDKDPRFGLTKAMLLFETPQDVLEFVEGGGELSEVNLGSMAHSKGKAVVTNALAMGNDDVETLEKLKEKGIKFDVRKVPADRAENLDHLLTKAKNELNK